MALPAEVKELAAKVRNWGRWGDDDEIGTLNLITDDVVKAAASEIKTGRAARARHPDGRARPADRRRSRVATTPSTR